MSPVCLNWGERVSNLEETLEHGKGMLELDRGSNFITIVGLSKVIQLGT